MSARIQTLPADITLGNPDVLSLYAQLLAGTVREAVRQLPGVRTAKIYDAHDLFPRLLRAGLENRQGAVSSRAVV